MDCSYHWKLGFLFFFNSTAYPFSLTQLLTHGTFSIVISYLSRKSSFLQGEIYQWLLSVMRGWNHCLVALYLLILVARGTTVGEGFCLQALTWDFPEHLVVLIIIWYSMLDLTEMSWSALLLLKPIHLMFETLPRKWSTRKITTMWLHYTQLA